MKAILLAVLSAGLLAACGDKNSSAKEAASPAPPPVAAASVAPIKSGASWALRRSKDDLTDEKRVTARIYGGESYRQTEIAVRCMGGDLDVVVGFAEYLGNESRPVKYRFDQGDVKDGDWSITSQGTALYVTADSDFSRKLIRSKKVIVETSDFRGVSHRVSFDYGDTSAIESVLDECKVPLTSLDEKIPGLRPDLALQMERWGPKNITTKKQALAQIAGFKGAIDDEMTPEFALAVQAYSDSYVERCKARKINGDNCKTMRIFWDAKVKQSEPWASSLIYEQAPKSLRPEMGKLKNTD